MILSDDPQASQKITAFAEGDQRIAVCVRMVSEGVDIPRAACLAWMTSYRTPLFFAQGVGRVVRARGRHESATVFLPAVRPLLALAAELEQERNHVIAPPSGSDAELLDVLPMQREASERETVELVDADAAFAHVLHAGRAVVAEGRAHPTELTDEDEDFLGLPGILSPEQMAGLLARRDHHARRRAGGLAGSAPAEKTPAWRAGVELRHEVNRLVGVVAARQGRPHAQIHAELRRAVPGPTSTAAGTDVLERRRQHLLAMIT